MMEYLWLVTLLPLIAFVIVIIFGRWLWEGGALIVITSLGISFVLALTGMIQFFTGGFEPFELILSFSWLGSGAESIKLGLLVDNLSIIMLTLVSFLCFIIAIYSIGYMAKESGKPRYYAEIALFSAGMLGTVSANNYLQLLIFWEVMGLCSYLLIGFWYKKPEAASAAKKAFLVTRVGDVMLLLGIIIVFTQLGTFNFTEIAASAGGLDPRLMTLIPLLIFGGAIGKSAQFPLHVWLPDAMEGPTTVSALIHAATMVNAGVFLTARAFPLLIQSPQALLFVAIIGGFTAFFAATMALTAYDIKRVLAYSTISQLGYMILALGAGGFIFIYSGMTDSSGYSAALFHLMNHAFFKALLFLAAGSVIHAVHTNDMRFMGGLRKRMKITSTTMLIAAISIAGIPPFSGFWSKDEILAGVFKAGDLNSIFLILWVLGMLTVFMTAFYMFRLWFMTFGGKKRRKDVEVDIKDKRIIGWHAESRESPRIMTIPLIVLAFFAFASGLFIFFTNGFGNVIFYEHAHALAPMEILSHVFTEPLTYLSIFLALGGIGLAYLVYQKESISASVFTSSRSAKFIQKMLASRYWINDAYNYFGSKIYYGFAKVADWFDRKIIDGFVNGVAKSGLVTARAHDIVDRYGVDGVVNSISLGAIRGSRKLRRGQRGYVQDYAAVIILGVCLVIFLIEVVFPLLGVK